MTAAHVPSDDTAIAAAHDRLTEIAGARLRAVCEDLIGNPTSPWLVEQVEIAARAVHHQGIADLRAIMEQTHQARRLGKGR